MRIHAFIGALLATFIVTGCSTGAGKASDLKVNLEARVKQSRTIAGVMIGDVIRDGHDIDLEVLTPSEMNARVLNVFVDDSTVARLGGDAFLAKIRVGQRLRFAIQRKRLKDNRWFEWGHLESVEFLDSTALQE
jgi:hypothetical protein